MKITGIRIVELRLVRSIRRNGVVYLEDPYSERRNNQNELYVWVAGSQGRDYVVALLRKERKTTTTVPTSPARE